MKYLLTLMLAITMAATSAAESDTGKVPTIPAVFVKLKHPQYWIMKGENGSMIACTTVNGDVLILLPGIKNNCWR